MEYAPEIANENEDAEAHEGYNALNLWLHGFIMYAGPVQALMLHVIVM